MEPAQSPASQDEKPQGAPESSRRTIIGREEETALIQSLLRLNDVNSPAPNLIICGRAGMGKTLTLKTLLMLNRAPFVQIDFSEARTTTFLKNILRGLWASLVKCDPACLNTPRPPTVHDTLDFVVAMKRLLASVTRRCVIVLDPIEDKADLHMLAYMAELPRLTAGRLAVLFVMRLSPHLLASLQSIVNNDPLAFRPYSKETMVEIVLQRQRKQLTNKGFEAFLGRYLVGRIVGSLLRWSWEVSEVADVTAKILDMLPLPDATTTEASLAVGLDEKISAVARRELYTRQEDAWQGQSGQVAQESRLLSWLKVAGFLASATSKKHDRQVFSRENVGRKADFQVGKLSANPLDFSRDRLLQVLGVILDTGEPEVNIQVDSAIRTLVEARVFHQSSAHGNLRCTLSYAVVEPIAKELGIKLEGYLRR